MSASATAKGSFESAPALVSRRRPCDPESGPGARRRALALIGGGLAGLLAGVDAILLVFLGAMLRGDGGDTGDLIVAGIGHAGWSAARGIELGIAPGGLAILLGLTGLGAWATRLGIGRRSPRGRPRGAA